MNIIKKIILFIRNIFIKQDTVKKLPDQKVVTKENKKESFIKAIQEKS